jgi:hypothetical protein
MNEVIERRLEFLKLEALGFSLCEIVKTLSEKWQKTERSIYYDAETRETWQPLLTQLFELDKARLMVTNRYEFIYREAVFMLKQGNDAHKPAALNIMLNVTEKLVALLGLETLRETEDKKKNQELTRAELAKMEALLEVKDKVTA